MQLDQNVRARLRFHPAAVDEGIVFIRSDLPGHPRVRCAPENLRSMPRWTALEENEVWVHHTEHVLAAIALCGVDNVRVEMDADRVPMPRDVSCATFFDALTQVGVRQFDAARQVYVLDKAVFCLDPERTTGERTDVPELKDGRYILGVPSDRLSVSYVFHWPHVEGLPAGVAEYDASARAGVRDYITARSYLIEGENVRNLLGSVQDDLMRLYPGCPMALGREAARHKVVDFIGDLRVLGRPLLGRFIAFRTGHRIHHNFVGQLVREHAIKPMNMD